MGEIRERGVVAAPELLEKLRAAKAEKRNDKGKIWTYEDIAAAAGVDPKTVGRIFRREEGVDESNIRAVCKKAFGLKDNEVVIARSPRSEEEDRKGQLGNPINMNNLSATQQGLTPSTSVVTQRIVVTMGGTSYEVFVRDRGTQNAVELTFQALGGDVSIRIENIEEGSIKITFSGSPQGLKRLDDLFKSGALTEVLGLPIEDVQLITRDIESESNTNSEDKVRIIQEIVTQGAERRNLSGVDLSNTNLEYANLHDADLSDANLSGTNLSDANLSSANLSNADLIGANLGRANLIGADLIGANLGRAYLRSAKLDLANLRSANLSDAYLSDAYLVCANLSDANLGRANLLGANLLGANLSDANLSDANLSEAKLRRANLRGANLIGANLGHAKLEKAEIDDTTKLNNKWRLVWRIKNSQIDDGTLYGKLRLLWRNKNQDLRRANLSSADLTNVNLCSVKLSDADLSDANLTSADLSSANLFSTDLSGADLCLANLSRAELCLACLSGANLSHANLSRANLNRANLSGANLSGANLRRANLSRANLSRANLSGTKLYNASLQEAANVEGAKLGIGLGLTYSEKLALAERGAIFDDLSRGRSFSRSQP